MFDALGRSLLALVPAVIVRRTVDTVLRHPPSAHFLLVAGSAIVGVSLAQGLCLFFSRRLIIGMSGMFSSVCGRSSSITCCGSPCSIFMTRALAI